MALQHLRSSTANKRPTPAVMSDGQLAMNTNLASPGLFLKDSNGDLVKVGPVHVGTTAPNATPGAGGQAGNSKGEQWLDTSSSRYVFKIWDGTDWRTEDGEFVNSSGDTMTGALGVIAGTNTAPGIFFSGDTNTGLFSPSADQLAVATNGVERVEFGTSEVVFNDGGANYDFRIEGDTEANLVFVDASTDRVGIGTDNPKSTLSVSSSSPGPGYQDAAGVDNTTIVTNGSSSATRNGIRVISTNYDGASTAYLDLVNPGSKNFNIRSGFRIIAGVSAGGATSNEYLAFSSVALTGSSFSDSYTETERARIDSSGRLLVGTSTSSAASKLIVQGNVSGGNFAQMDIAFNSDASTLSADTTIGTLRFTDQGGGNVLAGITCATDAACGAGDFPGRLVFSTTADGAASPTERMRITSVGATNGNLVMYVGGDGFQATDGRHGLAVYRTENNALANAANSVVKIGLMQTTSRSINAAGTVNASGGDYAEYMTKAGNFTIAKGDICGITASGQLTTEFVNAVGFAVKSTNPSYVGGDTWGNAEVIGERPEDDADAMVIWEAALEVARQQVDRIAFAGQVPVNVTGAIPGQYIVPIAAEDGGITGIAKDEADLSLVEYMRSVGKVIAIEDDGRARIIVKVA